MMTRKSHDHELRIKPMKTFSVVQNFVDNFSILQIVVNHQPFPLPSVRYSLFMMVPGNYLVVLNRVCVVYFSV